MLCKTVIAFQPWLHFVNLLDIFVSDNAVSLSPVHSRADEHFYEKQ